METRLFRDYYSKRMKEEFPDIEESSLRSILDHGIRHLIKILTTDKDIMLMSANDFWAFAGKISYDQGERDARAKILKRKKIRSRGLHSCAKWSREYYMPVSNAQYHDISVNKNYIGMKLYKMIDEAKGTSCSFILKVTLKEIERKYIINFYNHETDSVECIFRWSKYGYKRTNNSGLYLDGLP